MFEVRLDRCDTLTKNRSDKTIPSLIPLPYLTKFTQTIGFREDGPNEALISMCVFLLKHAIQPPGKYFDRSWITSKKV